MNETNQPVPRPAQSRAWMYEVPVFYLALILLQRALRPDDPSFLSVNPSPLWLGLLLFGLRYGMGAGLASGLVAAGLHALGVEWSGESFRFEDADFYAAPGLFVLVGAAVGAAADSFRHRIQTLLDDSADLTDRNRGLQSQIVVQQKAMRAIEQQVVSQMSSVVTLYHGSRQLASLDRAELMAAVSDFFTRALQATKTALYLPEGGRWVLSRRIGWAHDAEYPAVVEAGQGIVGRAAADKKPSSIKDWLVGEIGEGVELPDKADAIMAAPLLSPDGDPVAVFAVQAMPFMRFNSASLNLLTLLADWGSEAYAKCLQVEELRARSILDERFATHSAGYFKSRLKQEFSRSVRHALPFSVLLVVPSPDVPETRREAYLQALCSVLRDSVREGDLVASTEDPAAPFAIVLMTATRERAEEVRMRIAQSTVKLGLPEGARYGVGSFAHTMKNPEEIVANARQDVH